MTAFRCDCCKRFFVTRKGNRMMMTLSDFNFDVTYDLCVPCADKIKELVVNTKEPATKIDKEEK